MCAFHVLFFPLSPPVHFEEEFNKVLLAFLDSLPGKSKL